MFKKVLYIIVVLLIGQVVLAFNIASIRSDKRLELEKEALFPADTTKAKDFDYILKNINGKFIGADKSNESAYYNLEPVLKCETENLNVYFFEFFGEITVNKELTKDSILYILITDINEKFLNAEVAKDESSLELTFDGEKKVDPYSMNMTTYEPGFYELIFSAKTIKDQEYGSIMKNLEIKDAKKETIFKLSDFKAEGIDFKTLTGEALKTQVDSNENYKKCLTRTEHYENLPYKQKMGKIIGALSIYAVIVLAIAFLLFRPRKKHTHTPYSNYKPANYKSNYAQNIKSKAPSQQAYEKQLIEEKTDNVIDEPKAEPQENNTKEK